MRDLPNKRFDVILADPPWSYSGDPNKMGAAGKHYSMMSMRELIQVPISSRFHPRTVVFMWATGPKLYDACILLDQWGLYFRGVAFVWVKTKKDGTPIGAQGVRPSIVKPTCEFVLVGSPKRTGRPLPLASEKVVQTVLAPRREHSRKPDEVMERIEQLYPEQSKLELFARYKRPGWEQWGNEELKSA